MSKEYRIAFGSDMTMLVKDAEAGCSDNVISSDINHLHILVSAFHDKRGVKVWHKASDLIGDTDMASHADELADLLDKLDNDNL